MNLCYYTLGEQDCKRQCQGYLKLSGDYAPCTHYKYYQPNKDDPPADTDEKCEFYHVNTSTTVPSYSCNMHIAVKLISPKPEGKEMDLQTCLKDVTPSIGGGPGPTTEDPGSISSSTGYIFVPFLHKISKSYIDYWKNAFNPSFDQCHRQSQIFPVS